MIDFGNLACYTTIPKPTQKRMHAYGIVIIYYPTSGIADLYNQAQATQGNNIIKSSHIHYRVKDGIITTASSKNQKTQGRIHITQ